LVEKGDHKEWIDKLSILINDNKKARQMGKAGRSFITKNFNWEWIAKEFLDKTENILTTHKLE